MEVAAAFAASLDEMAALVEELRADMRRQWKQFWRIEGSFLQPVIGFVSSVDWTEPWLLALMIFHVYLLVVSIKSRKDNNLQMGIFFFGFVGIYFAERLNVLLARSWNRFARHPYFDQSGVFLSTVWSGPLLLISIVILVSFWNVISTFVG
ncbi:hypothetical protein O6H91_18G073100 [Diphasiastrum complanatum]|uniref:Uncharacterized protein n=1 Tax=Diphasiastrum complanatum TaxID=34168 RepID=A0ACC2B2L0_DIPCM|nr:hypothetical protein O6H91_18G073100 [Diphasiastrum complanatum]